MSAATALVLLALAGTPSAQSLRESAPVPSIDAAIAYPAMLAGAAGWLAYVAARRMERGDQFFLYCVVTVAAAAASAVFMTDLYDRGVFGSIFDTSDAARSLLAFAMGLLVPLLLAIGDRVPWRWWTWGLLGLFPVVFLSAVQLLPPWADTLIWLQFSALAWLALLPAALRAILRSPPGRSQRIDPESSTRSI